MLNCLGLKDSAYIGIGRWEVNEAPYVKYNMFYD